MEFILSDRVPNCLLEAMEDLYWFTLTFTTENMRKYFGTNAIPIRVHSFHNAVPFLEEKYGPDQELAIKWDLKKPQVHFGYNVRSVKADVLFSTQLNYQVSVVNGAASGETAQDQVIFYDEMDFEMGFDMVVEQEVVYADINHMKLMQAGDDDREFPLFQQLDMTVE